MINTSTCKHVNINALLSLLKLLIFLSRKTLLCILMLNHSLGPEIDVILIGESLFEVLLLLGGLQKK